MQTAITDVLTISFTLTDLWHLFTDSNNLIRLSKSYNKTVTDLRKTRQIVAIWRLELIQEPHCNNGKLLLLLFKTQSKYKLLCLRHWALYLRVVATDVLFTMSYIICIVVMLYIIYITHITHILYIIIYIYIYIYICWIYYILHILYSI